MKGFEDSYFINRLEEGKYTSLMLMAHNAYWCQLERFQKLFSNFKLSIFGSGTSYARMRKNDIPKDADFILLDTGDFYSEYEYFFAKDLAKNISNKKNKRVTFGYLYVIPEEDRIDKGMSCEFKITSIKNNDIDEENISIASHGGLLELADMIVKTHECLENQKDLKYHK